MCTNFLIHDKEMHETEMSVLSNESLVNTFVYTTNFIRFCKVDLGFKFTFPTLP